MSLKTSYFLTFFITCLFLSLLFIVALNNALPVNPLNKYKNTIIAAIFPQGWGFFSKDPRDENIYIYDTNLQFAADWPNNNLSNFFGLKRKGRAQGIEYGLLYVQIPEEKWIECDHSLAACIKENPSSSINIENPSPNPSFCGEYYLVTREVIPWAWANLMELDDVPLKYAKVVSSCTVN